MHPRKGTLRRVRRQAGMALVLVLWIVTLLSVVAASFSLGVRRDAGVAHHLVQATRAQAAAEAGVRIAMLGLDHPDPEQRWQPGEGTRTLDWGDARLEITVRLESGRVDINRAPPALLHGVLGAAGVEDAARRDAIVGQILEWRGARVEHGGAATDYAGFGLGYGPAGAPFQALEELLLLPGIGAETYQRLEPLVTILSGSARVDPAQAAESVLHALPGVDAAQIDGWLDQRARAREAGEPPPPLAAEHVVSGGTDVHTVRSIAELPSGARFAVQAVMEESRDDSPEPFRIIHYRQDR